MTVNQIPLTHSEAYELFDETHVSRRGFSTITIARYQSINKHPDGTKQNAEYHYFTMLYQDGIAVRRIAEYDHALRYVDWLLKRQHRAKPLKYKAAA